MRRPPRPSSGNHPSAAAEANRRLRLLASASPSSAVWYYFSSCGSTAKSAAAPLDRRCAGTEFLLLELGYLLLLELEPLLHLKLVWSRSSSSSGFLPL
ncbi:hypothetical protein E2562_017117 [Oryza meyeriana var. granulata]|uniref:Uncharacterized protein n=1 Tax=Oryza meyeriana var. granulata TaxID=110450 RepID=A0A6G1DYM5_9ORYZ|nr:hypothetical protein E2562_017117 [Oryza meyeriana var. granulata]